jgi:DNA-binding protein H-NS
MAAPNFEKMSLKELLDLDVRLQKAITNAKRRERDVVKEKVQSLLNNAGLSAEELFGGRRGGGRGNKGGKVAPKYRNPDNPSETWTGRGRQPRWLAAKLSKGGKIADFTI